MDTMDQAALIVAIPGVTEGLRWELATLAARGHFSKTILIFPPYDALRAQRVEMLLREFGDSEIASSLRRTIGRNTHVVAGRPDGGVTAFCWADDEAVDQRYETALRTGA
jgi:hypothetical protein